MMKYMKRTQWGGYRFKQNLPVQLCFKKGPVALCDKAWSVKKYFRLVQSVQYNNMTELNRMYVSMYLCFVFLSRNSTKTH